MSANPWTNIGGFAGMMADMASMSASYLAQATLEMEQRQLEEALDSWENEGGSGPACVVVSVPSETWGHVQLTNGNGRWNATGWHPHGDIFVLLLACEASSDEKVREMARKLLGRWGFV